MSESGPHWASYNNIVAWCRENTAVVLSCHQGDNNRRNTDIICYPIVNHISRGNGLQHCFYLLIVYNNPVSHSKMGPKAFLSPISIYPSYGTIYIYKAVCYSVCNQSTES